MADPVSEYIDAQSAEARPQLKELRAAIESAAPTAEGGQSYGVVMYRYNGRQLGGFGAAAKHAAYYGSLGGHQELFSQYKTGKGSIQFPFGEKIPVADIKRLIKLQMAKIDA
jgi:uncharacterized protein YdhG (YjbR/CyaY superfamily)